MAGRITDYRKEIFKIIKGSENPLSVKEIHSAMAKKPDLSTIYRALNFLVSKKGVKTISFPDFDNMSFFYFCDKTPCHFIFCASCHRAKDFHICNADAISKDVETETGYQVTGHALYFTGICSECQNL